MARPSVSLSIPPERGHLHAWGRDVGGEWWALIVWDVLVSPQGGGHPRFAICAAWASGRSVDLPDPPVAYLEVPRMQLGAEPAEWPPPRDRPGAVWDLESSFYLGVLDGAEPRLPAEAGRPWGDHQGSAYG